MTKNYNIKYLVNGFKIKPSLRSRTLIAVPKKYIDTNMNVKVTYKDKSMLINKQTPLLAQSDPFPDKFGGQPYIMAYFEWLPNKSQLNLF